MFPVVPPIASGTIGSKSRRIYATEEEALRAAELVKGKRGQGWNYKTTRANCNGGTL